MLRRDTKVILPILDGWAKLLNEEREEVKQLVLQTLNQVLARCLLLSLFCLLWRKLISP